MVSKILANMPATDIHLTDQLHARLESRAAENGFDSVQAYVEAVLFADTAGPAIDDEQLEALLLGRVDGPFADADAADFKRMREKLAERLGNET